MIRATEEQRALLRGFERFAFAACDFANRDPRCKRLGHAFLRTVGRTWVHACTKNLLQIKGIEHVRALDPNRGVMIVANHRSFFDLYVVSSVLLRETSWIERMFFPVRSTYFYERADGLLVNAAMSALAMYPPVLRRQEARAFNEYTVDFLVDAIESRGTVVGMHPEGTRSRGDDPYALLPAQPGVGQIVRAAKPIVLPVFLLGLGNDLARQLKGNFDRTGDPITMVFGAPLDLTALFEEPPRLRTYKKIADRLRDALLDLAVEERAFREERGFRPLVPITPPTRSDPRISTPVE